MVLIFAYSMGATKYALFSCPFIILGGYLAVKGSQKRFNFKRNSGLKIEIKAGGFYECSPFTTQKEGLFTAPPDSIRSITRQID